MRQSGITTEEKPVVADVFRLVGTRGIPLDMVLTEVKKNGLVVDWLDYIRAAQADGAKLPRLVGNIVAAVEDVYGMEYAREVEKRLKAASGERSCPEAEAATVLPKV